MADIIRQRTVAAALKAELRRDKVTAKATYPAEKPERRDSAVKAPAKLDAQSRKRVREVVPNTFRLGYLMHDVSRLRRTLFDQHMKPEGLTRSQWWLLANLSRKEGAGTKSSELAKQLDVGKVTVGGLVDRLEAAGYVFRRVGRADRRSKLIFITVKGYEVISRMRMIAEDLNRDLVKGMSKEDIAISERYLLVMKKNVIRMLGDDAFADD